MKVTIWIPDDLVDEIKESAYQSRKSVSGYLVDLHRVNFSSLEAAGAMKNQTDLPASGDFLDALNPDPLQKAAKDLTKVTKKKQAGGHDFMKAVKKGSKLSSGCPECRAPHGHRVGCLLGVK